MDFVGSYFADRLIKCSKYWVNIVDVVCSPKGGSKKLIHTYGVRFKALFFKLTIIVRLTSAVLICLTCPTSVRSAWESRYLSVNHFLGES